MGLDKIIDILEHKDEYDHSELDEAIIFAIAELRSLKELKKMEEN